MNSKLIEATVKRMPELESYHIEKCDGKIQHWVYAKDGFLFPETETTSINGFDVREVNKVIKTTARTDDFYN